MHAQAQPRLAKRMPCAVRVGERRYTGMVINLSQGGLFVQTNADTSRGERVELEISAPERSEAIPVQGTVVWKRAVPPQLRSAARGGMGVRIQSAAETYYQLLAAWMRVAPIAASAARAAGEAAAADAPPTWRVRVRATSLMSEALNRTIGFTCSMPAAHAATRGTRPPRAR